jgi:hypothetical protein
METKHAAGVEPFAMDAGPAPCVAQANQPPQPQQWESFPQPAGWSADWDFEELDRAPRLNGRSAAIVSPDGGAEKSADGA